MREFQIPDGNVDATKNLRKSYGDMQTAFIRLPAVWPYNLLKVDKVKIGWAVYRIREKISPVMCCKCLSTIIKPDHAQASTTGLTDVGV